MFLTSTELQQRITDTIALLQVPGVGRGRFSKLVKQFGTPSDVFERSLGDLETVTGISRTIATAIKSAHDKEAARTIYARIAQLGWEILFPEHAEYPKPLCTIPDSPPLIFRVGLPWTPDDKMIAIVGTRHASEKGRQFTTTLAGELTRAGMTIVSGMAEGIDSAAHIGALDAGGKTVAVWGTPLNLVYPPINRGLAERIGKTGSVYSEYFPDTRVDPAYFPERNRIISGLSEGTIVVEAGRKSGALITASCAVAQGRELFAVPGAPDNPHSLGTNALIKNGARLLTEAQDLFDEIPRLRGEVTARRFQALPDLTDTEKRVVSAMVGGPFQLDQLSRLVELPVAELMEYLLALELKGVVQELSGKRFGLSD